MPCRGLRSRRTRSGNSGASRAATASPTTPAPTTVRPVSVIGSLPASRPYATLPDVRPPDQLGGNLMIHGSPTGVSRLRSRVKAMAIGILPLSAWERLLRLAPVRSLRDAIVGPSDTGHLAEGPVRFERLEFQFTAPYRTWVRARQKGIENRICRLFLSHCRDGFVGIDVGANCG